VIAGFRWRDFSPRGRTARANECRKRRILTGNRFDASIRSRLTYLHLRAMFAESLAANAHLAHLAHYFVHLASQLSENTKSSVKDHRGASKRGSVSENGRFSFGRFIHSLEVSARRNLRHSRGRHLDRSAMFGRVRRSFEARDIRNSSKNRSIMTCRTDARIDHDRILEDAIGRRSFRPRNIPRSNRSTQHSKLRARSRVQSSA